MRKNRLIKKVFNCFVFVSFLVIGGLFLQQAFFKTIKIPNDFKVSRQGNGVVLYHRTNRYGGKDLLQEVDLSTGAKAVLLVERQTNIIQNPADPEFQRNPLNMIWKRFKRSYPRAFSLSSGAFFGLYREIQE